MTYPRIVGRTTRVLSPWVSVLEKEVSFREGDLVERGALAYRVLDNNV